MTVLINRSMSWIQPLAIASWRKMTVCALVGALFLAAGGWCQECEWEEEVPCDTVTLRDGSVLEGIVAEVPLIQYSFGEVSFAVEELDTIAVGHGKIEYITQSGQRFIGDLPGTPIVFHEQIYDPDAESGCYDDGSFSADEEGGISVRALYLDPATVRSIVLYPRNYSEPMLHDRFFSFTLRNGDAFPAVIDTWEVCLWDGIKSSKVRTERISTVTQTKGGLYGYLTGEAVPIELPYTELVDEYITVRLAKNGQALVLPWYEVDTIFDDAGSTGSSAVYPTLGSVSDAVVLVPSGRFVVGGGLAAVQEAGRRISGLATDPLAVARGSFTSGGSHRQELRGRIVEMPAYYIDKYEVTNRAYAEFVNATRRRPPHHWKRGAPVPGTEDHPVVNVSYVDAAAYAAWRGMRLPTEVEWERAAKGAGGALYPYGKEYNPLFANTEADGTRPVGSYEALLHRAGVQGLGLGHTASDMSGNVAEWTASVYDPFDYDIAIGGDGRYNPYLTKQRSEFRVVRGGSYGSSAVTATTVYRERMHEQDFNSHTGFRCVADKE